MGRRPIPQGRAAPFRRPAAAGTLGRLWSGCRVPLRTARVGPRITPSQSAHSPQSPQKVRNSASIGRRRPTAPNLEAAGQAQVPSSTTRSRVSRVSSGSTSGAGSCLLARARPIQVLRLSMRVRAPSSTRRMAPGFPAGPRRLWCDVARQESIAVGTRSGATASPRGPRRRSAQPA